MNTCTTCRQAWKFADELYQKVYDAQSRGRVIKMIGEATVNKWGYIYSHAMKMFCTQCGHLYDRLFEAIHCGRPHHIFVPHVAGPLYVPAPILPPAPPVPDDEVIEVGDLEPWDMVDENDIE